MSQLLPVSEKELTVLHTLTYMVCMPARQTAQAIFLWLLFILITPFGRSHSTCRQEMQTTAFVVVVYDCRVGIDAWYIDVFVVWISSVSFPDLHCKQSGNGTTM